MACEDCAWRREGVHENLGILLGEVCSLTGESEGRCLDFEPLEVLRWDGVMESSAKVWQSCRDTLREPEPPLPPCCDDEVVEFEGTRSCYDLCLSLLSLVSSEAVVDEEEEEIARI